MDCYRIALRESLGAVSFVGRGNVSISRVTCDSRDVQDGDLFVAISSRSTEGQEYILQAIARGAAAVVVEFPLPNIAIPQCVVPNARAAYSKICMALRANPCRQTQVAGVTGTNGKTTVTWLLRAIFQASGAIAGLLGTIEYFDGVESRPADLTTPDPQQLGQWFERMARNGVRYCAMEISSHALDQQRCAAMQLSAAAITNVTQDHFDYHGDLTAYRRAKSQIAALLKPGVPLLLNADDPGCCVLAKELNPAVNILWFGNSASAAVRADMLSSGRREHELRLRLMQNELTVTTALAGRHNVANVLTAAALAEQMGVPAEAIVRGLESVDAVPGRLERIDVGQPFDVLVDFAHTPDGLGNCLNAVRQSTSGRVICVFGAGGNRDRTKRPLMARAAEVADAIYVTSDNPRNEPALSIIEEICAGFSDRSRVNVCPDRAQAIRCAIDFAEAGDAVVIAGRGHEQTQRIGNRQICFDDRKVARAAVIQSMARPERISHFADMPQSREVPA